MALTIEDINDGRKIVRGSFGVATAVTTALTWVDLGNPGAVFPFTFRGGGPTIIAASVEATLTTFAGTFQVLLSLRDATPPTTPCGASLLGVPILGQTTSPNIFTIDKPARWIALNCSAFSSGSATGWVYGILGG